MHARRRNTGSESERVQIIEETSYSKLDKGNSKPYFNPPPDPYRHQDTPDNFNSSADEDTFPFLNEKEDYTLSVMTARDRTNEFSAAIRSLQGNTIARATAAKDVKKAQALQSYSQFMHSARIISKNISSTYSKLEKLAMCEYFV